MPVVDEQTPVGLQLHGGIEETPGLAARRLWPGYMAGVGLLEQIPASCLSGEG